MVNSAGIALVVALISALPYHGRSECILIPLPDVLKGRYAVRVFRGTLTNKDVISRNAGFGVEPVTENGDRFLEDYSARGMRLTFQVDRAWKGPVQKSLIVYDVLNGRDIPHWKLETDYLIVANPAVGEKFRKYLFLKPGQEGFVAADCRSAWSWTPAVEKDVVRTLGRGREPR